MSASSNDSAWKVGSARRAYLDHNASAPLLPAARAAVIAALDLVGNASSPHADGRAARAVVAAARGAVAAAVGADPAGVVFTASGTEAANAALDPAPLGEGGVLLVSAVEHACVLHGHRFPAERVRVLPVDGDGRLGLGALAGALRHLAGARPLLSLQAANNETGVLQPVAEAAALVRAAGGLTHCDAVQALGRVPLDLRALGADLLTLSAHKIGGPKGAGAVVLADAGRRLPALLRGGGQESGRRAGTEDVAAIAGFGAAAGAIPARLAAVPAVAAKRDRFEDGLRALAPGTIVLGSGAARLANTSAFALPGVTAEAALIALDLAGVSASTGAACSSGRFAASHVVEAMRVASHLRGSVLRVSIGPETEWNDLARALAVLGEVLARRQARAAA